MTFKGIVGVCFALLLTAEAAMAGSPSSTSTNVTSILHDYTSDGLTQLLLRSDDYNGTGQATYTTNKTGTVSSTIISSGEWQLFLNKQTLRAVWITPNDPVGSASATAAPPAGFYWTDTSVRTKCFDQNGNIVPLANVTTSSGNCSMAVTFLSGGTTYKLLMSPFPFSAAGDVQPQCPSTGCPATGLATVTCNSVSNGQCVSWTIVPNASGPNPDIANLYWYSSSKTSTAWVYIGQYYNTFRIDVTNP